MQSKAWSRGFATIALILVTTQPLIQQTEAKYRQPGSQRDKRYNHRLVDQTGYALYDATLARDVGSGEMEPGKHQHLSTFWTSHIQRSARAELALRINRAHKEAERDKSLKLHRLQGNVRRARTADSPVLIGGNPMFWPELYDTEKVLDLEYCDVPCRWTNNTAARAEADLVIYHPTYNPAEAQSIREFPDQGVAVFSMEPIFGMSANDMDAALSGYDFLVHLSKHADAVVTYAHTLQELLDGNAQEEFEAANPLPDSFVNGTRSMLATFITAGCDTDPNSTRGEQWSARNRLIKELMHLGITFDHFGECKFGTDAAAVQLPVPHKLGVSHHVITAQRRKVQILKHYKFALGMENFVREDYVTEKFYHMFASRRLGVYLGAPNAAAYAPQGSFINALEHSPDDLANLLRQLDADEDAYKSYFAWRLGDDDSTPGHFTDVISNSLMGQHMDGFEWVCKLCKLYHLHYDWETAQRDSLFASSNSVDDIQRQHLHA